MTNVSPPSPLTQGHRLAVLPGLAAALLLATASCKTVNSARQAQLDAADQRKADAAKQTTKAEFHQKITDLNGAITKLEASRVNARGELLVRRQELATNRARVLRAPEPEKPEKPKPADRHQRNQDSGANKEKVKDEAPTMELVEVSSEEALRQLTQIVEKDAPEELQKLQTAYAELTANREKLLLELPEDLKGEVNKLEEPKEVLNKQDLAMFWFIKGSMEHKLKRTKDAIASMQSGLDLWPDYSAGRRNLGILLLLEERYTDAIDTFQPELAKGLRDAELLWPLGQALFLAGQQDTDPSKVEAARVAFQSVLLERPNDPEVRRWLARLEFDTGRYEEAARLFEVFRKEAPLNPEYIEYLANCYVKLKRYEEAAALLEISAKVAPPSADSCRTLGDVYNVLGMPARSAEWYARAAGGDPAKAKSEDRLQVGHLFRDAAEPEEATRWLAAIPREDKQYAEAQSALAVTYKELGDTKMALASYEQAGLARPLDGWTFLSAGDIYLQDARDYDAAQRCYARAAALPETRLEGIEGLAEVAYAQRKLEEAATQYKKALELRPQDERLKAALRGIEDELRFAREEEARGQGGTEAGAPTG